MIRPFRAFVQMVLPTAYDDSLSYMELLSKVIAKLNEVVEQGNAEAEIIKELEALLDEAKLGEIVEEKVVEKLDEMASDGTLAELLNANLIDKPRMIKNTNGSVSKVLRTAASYLNRSGLTYGFQNAAFNRICTNEIDCVTFVQLAISDVPYENSRYDGNDKNYPGDGGFYIPTDEMYFRPGHDRPYGMLSSDLAHWCYDRGYLYETYDLEKVEIGDIAFCHTSDETVPFRNITHCALVVGKSASQVVVLETFNRTSDPVRQGARSINANDIVCFARLPFKDCYEIHNDFCKNKYMNDNALTGQKTVTLDDNGEGKIITLLTDKPLSARKPYTLVVKSKNIRAEWSVYLRGVNQNIIAGAPGRADGKISRVFFTSQGGRNPAPIGANNLGVYYYELKLKTPAGTAGPITVNIDEFHIYEGYCIESDNLTIPSEFITSHIASPDTISGSNLLAACTEIANKTPPCYPEQKFIRITPGTDEIPAGWYVLETCVIGDARNVGYQMLKGLGKNSIWYRFSTNLNWNEFKATVLYTVE